MIKKYFAQRFSISDVCIFSTLIILFKNANMGRATAEVS